MALQGGHEVPFEWIEMKLMEKFHWTPQELDSQSWDRIDIYMDIMNIESQFQEKEQRLADQKAKISKHKF